MGLLSLLLGSDEKDKKENTLFGLDDNQKRGVKEGKYDTWNFEEEDLEEDDYYYEDED